jgi:hypothetical protein
MIEHKTMEDYIINPPLPQNSVNKNEKSTSDNNNLNQGQYFNMTDQIDHFNTNNSYYQQNNSHFNNNFERRNNSNQRFQNNFQQKRY